MRKTRSQVVIRRDAVSSRAQNHRNQITTAAQTVRYGVCQKNHAASIGGYAFDGCREFMASGEQGSNGEFTCAACGCHRNFHKIEVEAHEVVSECPSPT